MAYLKDKQHICLLFDYLVKQWWSSFKLFYIDDLDKENGN